MNDRTQTDRTALRISIRNATLWRMEIRRATSKYTGGSLELAQARRDDSCSVA